MVCKNRLNYILRMVDKEIPEETLRSIINYAILVPSAFNLQPWEVIIIKSDESKIKLYNLCKREIVLKSPVTLLITHNKEAYDNYVLLGKLETNSSFGERNTGFLSLSIMYSASMYNIDSYPLKQIDFQAIKPAFKIADYKDVVMLISMDYYPNQSELHRQCFTRFFDDVATII